MAFAYISLFFMFISITTSGWGQVVFAQAEALPPLRGHSDQLSSMPRVFVRGFQIQGNTVFSDEELAAITAPYENREITFEELQDLRRKLTLHYVNGGYINSGAIIPDQKVLHNVILLRIMEGALSRIEVSGNKRFRTAYIVKRLMPPGGSPLNVYELQQALLVLQQDPRIKRINSELIPGALPRKSVLKVQVEENSPYKLGVETGNISSPSIGGVRAGIHLAHENISGHGDALEAHIGKTEGLFDYNITYRLPLNARDTVLALYYRRNESTVVTDDLKDIDIESRTDTSGISITHPLYKAPDREFSLGLMGEYRRSKSYLLDRGFSFESGVEDHENAVVSVLRCFQQYVSKSQKQVLAIRSTFSLGVDALNATVEHSDRQTQQLKGPDGEEMSMSITSPNGKFLSWLGQFQWIRRLTDDDLQFVFRTDIQLAGDYLMALERFAIGGMHSVRGYRENRLVRDNGFSSSLELRIPIMRNKMGQSILYLSPFCDYGASWNRGSSTPNPKTISSAGLGLRWIDTDKFTLALYGAIPFKDFDGDDMEKDLQDYGVHFLFTGYLF